MKKYQFVLIFNFLFITLDAYNSVDILKEDSVIFISNGTINPIPEQCTELLQQFAQSASNFTLCSITKAKPIRLCENCIEQYVNFTKTYEDLNKFVNESSCRSYFISQDRFDVVLEYHDHIMVVWNKGHCNDCFEYNGDSYSLSNNTLNFNKMARDTLTCINSTENNNDEVCVRCMQSYLQLNEFYKSLSKDSIGVDSVCMDTVDLMNITRSIWSKTLNCCKMRKSPEIIFLCCTAVISILPLLFYVSVRYCGPIRDLPRVLKESRFKQSILRSMQGRVN